MYIILQYIIYYTGARQAALGHAPGRAKTSNIPTTKHINPCVHVYVYIYIEREREIYTHC